MLIIQFPTNKLFNVFCCCKEGIIGIGHNCLQIVEEIIDKNTSLI